MHKTTEYPRLFYTNKQFATSRECPDILKHFRMPEYSNPSDGKLWYLGRIFYPPLTPMKDS